MQNLAYLLLGVRDSLSSTWLNNVLFYQRPRSMQVHPEAKNLFASIYRTGVQVILIYILLPLLLGYIALYFSVVKAIYYYSMMLVTILTYGYTFFYFSDVYSTATVIVKWNRKVSKEEGIPFAYGQMEETEKMGIFRGASNKLKSMIFLGCYGVFYALCSAVLIHVPYFGKLNLILSEAFFNGIFYFIRKWPYDEFNIGFFERKWAYLTGYGLVVSVVCNYLFQDFPLLSNGAYFLMSLWLIINMIVSSPPDLNISSFREVLQCLQQSRINSSNSYNTHRNNLRNPEYQSQVLKEIVFLKPILMATKYVQSKLEPMQQKEHK